MLLYKNTSMSAKTFYGITFQPGEIHEVPGYINDIKLIRVDSSLKAPPKAASVCKSTAPEKEAKPELNSAEQKTTTSKSAKVSSKESEEKLEDSQSNDEEIKQGGKADGSDNHK